MNSCVVGTVLTLERVRALLRRPVVFDGRTPREPDRMRRVGLEHYWTGPEPVLPG
jgi:hypothetical protein